MAINYCPKCGHKIEENIQYCPNCGAFLKEVSDNKDNFSYDFPKDDSWVKKWQSRALKSRIGSLILPGIATLIVAIGAIVCWIKNPDYWVAAIILLPFALMMFVFCFFAIFKAKNIVKKMDGYTVLVYRTFSQNALIVEGEMQDSQILYHSRGHHTIPHNLYGHLPNGRKIYTNIENVKDNPDVLFQD